MRSVFYLLLALLISGPAWADSHDDSGDADGGETSDDDSGEAGGDDSGEEGSGAEDSGEEAVEEAAAGEGSGDAQPAEEAAETEAETESEDTSKADELKGLNNDQSNSRIDAATAGAVVLKLPNGFELTPVARVQARVTLFDEDDPDRNDPILYGDPGLREGVSLRRVRLGLRASWRDLLSVSVVGGWDNRYDYTEAFGHTPKLTEAVVRLTPFDELGVSVGLTRVAFGRQAMTSSASLALWERSIASEHMAPDREVGAFLSGGFGPEENPVLSNNAFHWAFGISNGGGDWTGDADPSPRLAGRVSLDLGAPWEDVESGFSVGAFGLSVGGSLGHNWGLEADRLSAGVDLGVRFWRFSVQGEFMVSNAVPTFDTEGIPAQLAERFSMGGYGQLVFAIIPGTLEAAARVDGYDDNTSLSDAGDRLDIGGGVNFFLFDGRLKTQLNFVHRVELTESHATSNDSLILQVQARL